MCCYIVFTLGSPPAFEIEVAKCGAELRVEGLAGSSIGGAADISAVDVRPHNELLHVGLCDQVIEEPGGVTDAALRNNCLICHEAITCNKRTTAMSGC